MGGGGGGAMRSKLRRRPKSRSKSKVHADIKRCRIPEWTAEQYAAEAIECDRTYRGFEKPHFEVVKGLGCRRVLGYLSQELKKFGVRDFCHVSFYAKPTESNKIYKEEDTLLIFAELIDDGHHLFMLGHWWVSKPDDTTKITLGCGFCPPDDKYPHPKATDTDQYHTAKCVYTPPHLTQQLVLAKAFKKQVMCSEGDKRGRCQAIFEYDAYDPSSFTPDLSDNQYADIALKYINTKEDVEFVLNEILGATRQALLMMPDGYAHWCHVCFIAKPKSAGENNSPVTFFAELHAPRGKEYRVNMHHKFVSDERSLGCAFCQHTKKFPHPPTYTYKAGAFPRACVPDEEFSNY